MDKTYYVYILSDGFHGTLYVGVTNNLARRIYEHKNGLVEGFTKTYGIKKLVYYESHRDVTNAIQREKCIKRWKRIWKIRLINFQNPGWKDLSEDGLW
jgi:putative endonuclease